VSLLRRAISGAQRRSSLSVGDNLSENVEDLAASSTSPADGLSSQHSGVMFLGSQGLITIERQPIVCGETDTISDGRSNYVSEDGEICDHRMTLQVSNCRVADVLDEQSSGRGIRNERTVKGPSVNLDNLVFGSFANTLSGSSSALVGGHSVAGTGSLESLHVNPVVGDLASITDPQTTHLSQTQTGYDGREDVSLYDELDDLCNEIETAESNQPLCEEWKKMVAVHEDCVVSGASSECSVDLVYSCNAGVVLCGDHNYCRDVAHQHATHEDQYVSDEMNQSLTNDAESLAVTFIQAASTNQGKADRQNRLSNVTSLPNDTESCGATTAPSSGDQRVSASVSFVRKSPFVRLVPILTDSREVLSVVEDPDEEFVVLGEHVPMPSLRSSSSMKSSSCIKSSYTGIKQKMTNAPSKKTIPIQRKRKFPAEYLDETVPVLPITPLTNGGHFATMATISPSNTSNVKIISPLPRTNAGGVKINYSTHKTRRLSLTRSSLSAHTASTDSKYASTSRSNKSVTLFSRQKDSDVSSKISALGLKRLAQGTRSRPAVGRTSACRTSLFQSKRLRNGMSFNLSSKSKNAATANSTIAEKPIRKTALSAATAIKRSLRITIAQQFRAKLLKRKDACAPNQNPRKNANVPSRQNERSRKNAAGLGENNRAIPSRTIASTPATNTSTVVTRNRQNDLKSKSTVQTARVTPNLRAVVTRNLNNKVTPSKDTVTYSTRGTPIKLFHGRSRSYGMNWKNLETKSMSGISIRKVDDRLSKIIPGSIVAARLGIRTRSLSTGFNKRTPFEKQRDKNTSIAVKRKCQSVQMTKRKTADISALGAGAKTDSVSGRRKFSSEAGIKRLNRTVSSVSQECKTDPGKQRSATGRRTGRFKIGVRLSTPQISFHTLSPRSCESTYRKIRTDTVSVGSDTVAINLKSRFDEGSDIQKSFLSVESGNSFPCLRVCRVDDKDHYSCGGSRDTDILAGFRILLDSLPHSESSNRIEGTRIIEKKSCSDNFTTRMLRIGSRRPCRSITLSTNSAAQDVCVFQDTPKSLTCVAIEKLDGAITKTPSALNNDSQNLKNVAASLSLPGTISSSLLNKQLVVTISRLKESGGTHIMNHPKRRSVNKSHDKTLSNGSINTLPVDVVDNNNLDVITRDNFEEDSPHSSTYCNGKKSHSSCKVDTCLQKIQKITDSPVETENTTTSETNSDVNGIEADVGQLNKMKTSAMTYAMTIAMVV